ncbi:hypothetical protein DXG01_006076 [Tephrocybe rancida]|nr:hypothetical protein DXG01_006076 [Tephrocybe rancida]
MAEQRRERMPLSTSRDAPRFTHKQLEEVHRFLHRMETLFELAGIMDDQDKKKRVLEYVDAQTEKEWRGCDNFVAGSPWKDFVKEIKDSYPEAADDEGSIANLDQICREHARLGQGHTSELHSLICKFKAEARKLKEVIGNGVIVDKLMGCLTPAFADLVQDRLLTKFGHYKDKTRKRHKDNQYELSEVLIVVSTLIDETPRRGEREIGRSMPREASTAPVKVKIEEPEAEEKLAHLQDGVMAINKELTSMRSFMQTMTNELRNTSQFVQSSRGNSGTRFDSSAPTLHSAQQVGKGCFHCWEIGHHVAECEHMNHQVKEGALIYVDSRPRLPNGDPIPREPANISPRNRVNKLREQTVASFYGWVEDKPNDKTFSIYTNAVRDSRDNMLERINQGKVQKVQKQAEPETKKPTMTEEINVDELPQATYFISEGNIEGLPKGAAVHRDCVASYLEDMPVDE